MKNKQHEYILKAFVNTRIPTPLKGYSDLILLDSIIGGYCNQLLHHVKNISFVDKTIISKSDKDLFSHIINSSAGDKKEEIVFYYKLILLVEVVLQKYLSITNDREMNP